MKKKGRGVKVEERIREKERREREGEMGAEGIQQLH